MPIEMDDWQEGDASSRELVAAIVDDPTEDDGVRAFLWARDRIPPIIEDSDARMVDGSVYINVLAVLEAAGIDDPRAAHVSIDGEWMDAHLNEASSNVKRMKETIKDRYREVGEPEEDWSFE